MAQGVGGGAKTANDAMFFERLFAAKMTEFSAFVRVLRLSTLSNQLQSVPHTLLFVLCLATCSKLLPVRAPPLPEPIFSSLSQSVLCPSNTILHLLHHLHLWHSCSAPACTNENLTPQPCMP